MIPIAVLKSGVRIVNFSSPHSFTFDDGTVLPACTPERAKSLMLESVELVTPKDRWADIELIFSLSQKVSKALLELEMDEDVDLILVPFPVMEALKKANHPIGKCRVCRVADRVSKIIHADKFCI